MTPETFRELKRIYPGKNGDYIDGKGHVQEIKLEHTEELAELSGIILGDCHIQNQKETRENISSHRLVITLHEEETELLRDTKNLIQGITGKKPSTHNPKNSKAVQITFYSKIFIQELIKTGLEPGNEVKNQVEVPNWKRNINI